MSRDLRIYPLIEEGKVRMYVRGPTVYNYIHVGNACSTVALTRFVATLRIVATEGLYLTYR